MIAALGAVLLVVFLVLELRKQAKAAETDERSPFLRSFQQNYEQRAHGRKW